MMEDGSGSFISRSQCQRKCNSVFRWKIDGKLSRSTFTEEMRSDMENVSVLFPDLFWSNARGFRKTPCWDRNNKNLVDSFLAFEQMSKPPTVDWCAHQQLCFYLQLIWQRDCPPVVFHSQPNGKWVIFSVTQEICYVTWLSNRLKLGLYLIIDTEWWNNLLIDTYCNTTTG